MERRRLKAIIILILALLNVSLLWSVISRQLSRYQAGHGAAAQLSRIFAADGIALDADVIPLEDPPPVLPLAREEASEAAFAAAFLGEQAVQVDKGGGIHSYDSDSGTAVFRDDGSFEVSGTLNDGTPGTFCEKICKSFHADPAGIGSETGEGVFSTVFLHDGIRIYNCPLVFTLEHGSLIRVTGVLPGSAAGTESGSELLSASSALSLFLRRISESGAVISEITEIIPCYELSSTSFSPVTLVPCWRITTDTAIYYVNCISGNVALG